MTFDEILDLCQKTRSWVNTNATSQDIEKLTAFRMKVSSLKSTVGESLAKSCIESAKAEKNRRLSEDTTRYKEFMECDVASKAEIVAKNNSAHARAEEILCEGNEKAIRVLWTDLGDILDALSQRIATLRSEWSERNRQTT